MAASQPLPVTIITGFLGSGKTTLILNLIPQLPKNYRLALVKNEFGDVAVDSQLANASAISGVRELLNGCICCNLVGSLGDAMETLRVEQKPDRIVIETSGSAFPATLAMEVNRIGKETGHFVLDGVVSVIDVENWKGYDDTSMTAKLQASYTDLIVLNKWELVSERALEDCIDRILDLELDVPTARVQSTQGWVHRDALLGLDAKLARNILNANTKHDHDHRHDHTHDKTHQSEVEVLSITLTSTSPASGIDLDRLGKLLSDAPKDEVYRIKGIIYSLSAPVSSKGEQAAKPANPGFPGRYILNWAFSRWTMTAVPVGDPALNLPLASGTDTPVDPVPDTPAGAGSEPVARLTIVTARSESNKWMKRIRDRGYIMLGANSEMGHVTISRVS